MRISLIRKNGQSEQLWVRFPYSQFKINNKEIDKMTKEQELALMKNRLATLESNGKNIKSPGVVKKLRRRVKNFKK